ncbi:MULTISPECIES: cupredoxin domain-containing protein [Kitasatospora]|uniref:Cupredoxin domain-containing protein n=1 Tax=Kitasatospora cathayae TaxID=3004092 RepID=A0ABY7PXW4_9ACTN|nr:cupredoxin domain-containing protein [Kitasatospora sp. HUAS 3-15]WBP85012.1 cupredoxin domain-containing protein [Kitasatospora sp. HUAS 3-15]
MTSPRPLPAAAALLLSASLAACSSSGSSAGTPSISATSPVQSSAIATSPAQTSTGAVSPTSTLMASSPSSTGALHITIKDFAYSPASLTVSPGQTVTVTNQDTDGHTLTASDKSFDTGTIAPGATASFTAPQQTGAHPYICDIHPFMHGTLIVS